MSLVRRLCVIVFLFTVQCTTLNNNNNNESIEDSFRNCLISKSLPTSTGRMLFGHCLGIGAITKLQSLDNDPEFDLVDGLTLAKDDQQFREAYNFAESDPSDFRTIVDSLSHVFSHRSMHWDMAFLYPGLAMRVAPSASPGGVLEFVMDPHRDVVNQHSLKEFGTGRILARQFLLPFLLGFKFNVATIIPILFGLLALLAKKAIIISKIALIISSAYGLGTLLLGNGGNKYPTTATYGSSHSGAFNPGFGGGGGAFNRFPADEHEYQEVLYRGSKENHIPQQNLDQFKLYTTLQNAYERDDNNNKGRNFAWSDDEKKTKSVL